MQAVKPEWSSLQAQFTPLALSDRISCIVNELKALQHETLNTIPELSHFRLRKIQRFVEWTVPELLPDRAEEAEILVNVSRFAARLLIHEEAWNISSITIEIEQQIKRISVVQNIDRAE